MHACCTREGEILDSLQRGYVGGELKAHATGCAKCGELLVVAGALLEERSAALTEARVPGAGTMWWRMQLRRRREAQAAARRSLLGVQALTLSVAAVLVAILFGPELAEGARQALDTLPLGMPVLLILGAWLLAAPIGGYLVLRQK